MKTPDFKKKKENGQKITCLTCYDYSAARMAAETELDCLLVGDSVAMVVHGHASTIMADMPMMIRHTEAVARGLGHQFLISDLPFLSYRLSLGKTTRFAMQLMQAGAHAVKLEGGDTTACAHVQHLTEAGVPVVGHIGMTPQFVSQFGGFKVQGRLAEQARYIQEQALALETAGAIAVVLECIPAPLAKTISAQLQIPTIGIGAGLNTDGQILVWHDLLGLQQELMPRFVRQYVDGKTLFCAAIADYVHDVRNAFFPESAHSYV